MKRIIPGIMMTAVISFVMFLSMSVLPGLTAEVRAAGEDGILEEGFETTDTFWTAGGTVGVGLLSAAEDKAHTGSKSGATTNTNRAIMKKDLGSYAKNMTFSFWMYDDTSKNPSGSNTIGVRCDNNTSSTHRVGVGVRIGQGSSYNANYIITAAASAETVMDTGIPRSTGWHRFTFEYYGNPGGAGPDYGNLRIYIDDTLAMDSGGSRAIDTAFKTWAAANTYKNEVRMFYIGQLDGTATDGFYFDDVDLFWAGAYIKGPDVVIANKSGSGPKSVVYLDDGGDSLRRALNSGNSVWDLISVTPANGDVNFDIATKTLTVYDTFSVAGGVEVAIRLTNGSSVYNKVITVYPNQNNMFFADGFEKPASAAGAIPTPWTGAAGSAISHGTARSGAYYYAPNGTAADTIYYQLSSYKRAVVDVWMYDDATQQGKLNAVKFLDGNGNATEFGVGIINGSSYPATMDSINSAYGLYMGTNYRPTNIKRTTGWHKITYDSRSKLRIKMYFDDKLFFISERDSFINQNYYNGTIKKITLGQPTASYISTGFKFDDVRIYYDPALVNNAAIAPTLSGTAIAGASLSTGTTTATSSFVNHTSADAPISLILAVYDSTGTLVDVVSDNKTVNQGTTAAFAVSKNIASVSPSTFVKAFLWNSTTCEPQCDSSLFPYSTTP